MSHGITFATVATPADFALFSCQRGEWKSAFYEDGDLRDPEARFFPELFLELHLSRDLGAGLPDRDTVLIRGEGTPEGWRLVVDRHGYLELRTLAEKPIKFRAPTPLTTFASETFRLGLVLANVCRVWRGSRWWREALTYSRVMLLGARDDHGPLRPLGEWPLEAPNLSPVPQRVIVPAESWVVDARAFNTVRYELFEDREPVPTANQPTRHTERGTTDGVPAQTTSERKFLGGGLGENLFPKRLPPRERSDQKRPSGKQPPRSGSRQHDASPPGPHCPTASSGSSPTPHFSGDFPDSSRVFAFRGADQDAVDVFTGPEFVRSDSYWVLTRVSGARPGRTRLRLHTTTGYARRTPGMSPRFFWSPDREVWEELPLVEPTDESGRFFPLLRAPAESFYLSTSIPFMQHELAQLLDSVESLPFVSRKTLGASVAGRPITLLTMTDETVADDSKAHVVFIVGQHSPMEMAGAHLIAPLCRWFAARPDALRSLAVHCVPVVNVDCAAHGSDGMNLNLRNTNRCWFDDIQPETQCIMDHFDAQPWNPDLFLDLHAGGCWRNHTLLRLDPAFIRERFGAHGDDLVARQTAVNELLERHAGMRCVDGIDHQFRECCAKDWFKVRFPDCISCDLELSLCTYFDPVERVTKPVTQHSFDVVGAGLAAAFAEFATTLGRTGATTPPVTMAPAPIVD